MVASETVSGTHDNPPFATVTVTAANKNIFRTFLLSGSSEVSEVEVERALVKRSKGT